MSMFRYSALLTGSLLLSSCGGGSGSGQVGGDGTPAPSPEPQPLTVFDWQFSEAGAWVLSAEAGGAVAEVRAGRLALGSRASFSEVNNSVTCPVAAAEVSLDNPSLVAAGLKQLTLQLDVQRWDLGLGRFDSDVPQLELTLQGQRYVIGVSGFQKMPGSLQLTWTSAGLSAIYDGQVARAAVQGTPDTGPPRLRLWIDGCSQGLAQSLEIESLLIQAL